MIETLPIEGGACRLTSLSISLIRSILAFVSVMTETRATAMASVPRELCSQRLRNVPIAVCATSQTTLSKGWVFGTPIRPIRLTEGA